MALSATWRWGPAMHLMSLLKSLGMRGSSLVISQTSRTSRSSFKNMTSLAELAKGQYLNSPSTSSVAREGSLERKSMEHLRSYS